MTIDTTIFLTFIIYIEFIIIKTPINFYRTKIGYL